MLRAYLHTYGAAVAGGAVDIDSPVAEVDGGASGLEAELAFHALVLVDAAFHVSAAFYDFLDERAGRRRDDDEGLRRLVSGADGLFRRGEVVRVDKADVLFFDAAGMQRLSGRPDASARP